MAADSPVFRPGQLSTTLEKHVFRFRAPRGAVSDRSAEERPCSAAGPGAGCGLGCCSQEASALDNIKQLRSDKEFSEEKTFSEPRINSCFMLWPGEVAVYPTWKASSCGDGSRLTSLRGREEREGGQEVFFRCHPASKLHTRLLLLWLKTRKEASLLALLLHMFIQRQEGDTTAHRPASFSYIYSTKTDI